MKLKEVSSLTEKPTFLGIRGQVDEQMGLAVGVRWQKKSEKSESDASFNPDHLQIMTGLSGSQGEGIS